MPQFRVYPAKVKFAARESKEQSGYVDMVVTLGDGSERKLFAPLTDNFLADYSRFDELTVVEYPTSNGGVALVPAEDYVRSNGTDKFKPLSTPELDNMSTRADQYVAIIKEMYRVMAGLKEEDMETLDEETARGLTSTAFIQLFR